MHALRSAGRVRRRGQLQLEPADRILGGGAAVRGDSGVQPGDREADHGLQSEEVGLHPPGLQGRPRHWRLLGALRCHACPLRQVELPVVVRVQSGRGDRWHMRRGHHRRRRRPRALVALAAAAAGHSSRANVHLERLAVWLRGAHRTPPAPPHTCAARRFGVPRPRLTHMRLPLCSLSRAVGVGFRHDDRVGTGGLADAHRLPQLVRGPGGGIV